MAFSVSILRFGIPCVLFILLWGLQGVYGQSKTPQVLSDVILGTSDAYVSSWLYDVLPDSGFYVEFVQTKHVVEGDAKVYFVAPHQYTENKRVRVYFSAEGKITSVDSLLLPEEYAPEYDRLRMVDHKPSVRGGYLNLYRAYTPVDTRLFKRSSSQTVRKKRQPCHVIQADRYNANDSLLWSCRYFGRTPLLDECGASDEFPRLALEQPDGGWLLASDSYSRRGWDKQDRPRGKHNGDFWLIRVDSNGQRLWDRSLGGPGAERIAQALPTSDGGTLLIGTTNSRRCRHIKNGRPPATIWRHVIGFLIQAPFAWIDVWIVKIDSDGNIVWENRLTRNGADEVLNCMPLGDDRLLIVGNTNSNPQRRALNRYERLRSWMFEIDGQGRVQWDSVFAHNDSVAKSIWTFIPVEPEDTSHRKYLMGTATTSMQGSWVWPRSYAIHQVDERGAVEWSFQSQGEMLDLNFRRLEETGAYLLVGRHWEPREGAQNRLRIIVLKKP